MKLNIANPVTGKQKKVEIDDENRLRVFMEKRMAELIDGDELGDDFKGYVFKIMGGNDKDGFPMRQGVLVNKRVKLLLRRGMPCFKAVRKGDRARKAVRGCIVAPDIAALNLVIVKRGEQDIPGVTDVQVPRRLGPKRLGKIRKMFNLTKEDDPRDYIVRRKVTTASGKVVVKKPKIQRLITPTIRHRRASLAKRVANRKKASYEKRKAYFAAVSKVEQAVAAKSRKLAKKPTKKKSAGGSRKGSAKKGSSKKGSSKKTRSSRR